MFDYMILVPQLKYILNKTINFKLQWYKTYCVTKAITMVILIQS